MLGDLNKGRYKALELVAEQMRYPNADLHVNAIFLDIPDEDLKWVVERVHYYLLKLLEDAEYDPADDEADFDAIGLTD
jgi:hypothetical protein